MNGSRWRHRLHRTTSVLLAVWVAIVAVGQPLWANSVCKCRCLLRAADRPSDATRDPCCDPSHGSAHRSQGSCCGSCGHACCRSHASDDKLTGELTSSDRLPTTGLGLLCRTYCAGCRAVREDARTTSRPSIELAKSVAAVDDVLAVRPPAMTLSESGNQLDRHRRDLVALRPPLRVTHCVWRE